MYSFVVYIANAIVFIASIFSEKIAAMRRGRKETFGRIERAMRDVGDRKVYWVHCASLGEFEQGRPVIERLKKRFPNCFIAVSFFSPSGYRIRYNYEFADVVFYLPSDTKHNMVKLLDILKPDALFVVKYEFWYQMLKQASLYGTKVYLFSALFQSSMPFFKWYGGLFRKMLKYFNQIYVQDNKSMELLKDIGLGANAYITGDTRFDRVVENRENVTELPIIREFIRSSKEIFICGSTWTADQDVLIPFILSQRDVKFIIAPHQMHADDLNSLEAALMSRGVLRYTKASVYDNFECPGVLIIDCIGILNSAYQYGTKAYIGGGFGAGIHNVLEPAVWGLPLMFGPNYKRFKEAEDLVRLKGAVVVRTFEDLNEGYQNYVGTFAHASDIVSSYVDCRKGASDRILNNIFGKLEN